MAGFIGTFFVVCTALQAMSARSVTKQFFWFVTAGNLLQGVADFD
jgi:hypothetical protein